MNSLAPLPRPTTPEPVIRSLDTPFDLQPSTHLDDASNLFGFDSDDGNSERAECSLSRLGSTRISFEDSNVTEELMDEASPQKCVRNSFPPHVSDVLKVSRFEAR